MMFSPDGTPIVERDALARIQNARLPLIAIVQPFDGSIQDQVFKFSSATSLWPRSERHDGIADVSSTLGYLASAGPSMPLEVRLRAIQALRGVRHNVAQWYLLELLADTNLHVQFSAAAGLVAPNDQAREILRRGIDEISPNERTYSYGLRQLMLCSDEDAEQILKSAWEKADYKRIERCLGALYGHSAPICLVPMIEQVLNAPTSSIPIKDLCVRALARDNRSVVSYLEGRLLSADVSSALDAALLLGRENTKARVFMNDILAERGPIPSLRRAARSKMWSQSWKALKQGDAQGVYLPLAGGSVVIDDQIQQFKVQVASALFKTGDPSAKKVLNALLGSDDPREGLRAASIMGASSLEARRWLKAKIRIGDSDEVAVGAALILAGTDSEANRACRDLVLRSSRISVRLQAACALGIQDYEARQFLERTVIVGGWPYVDAVEALNRELHRASPLSISKIAKP